MFTTVGYDDISAEFDPHATSSFKVTLRIDTGKHLLSLEELHNLREVVDHMITLATAKEVEGT